MYRLEPFRWWPSRSIDDEVTNLPHKQVGRGPSRLAVISVWTGINQSKSFECRGCLKNWEVAGITDELCHIIEYDRLVNKICARRYIYHRRRVSRRVADEGTAAVAVRNGAIEGIRIISDTVAFAPIRLILTVRLRLRTFCPVFLDITKYFIRSRIGIESSSALSRQVVQPIAIGKGSKRRHVTFEPRSGLGNGGVR